MKTAIFLILAVTCVVSASRLNAEAGANPWSHSSGDKWCLAVEANGDNQDLSYSSPLWTNKDLYEKNGNRKTEAFFTKFTALKFEFCETGAGGKCNSKVTYNYRDFESLLDLFTKVQSHGEYTKESGMGDSGVKWKDMIPGGGNVQDSCYIDGANIQFKSVKTNVTNTMKARFGGMWSSDKNCTSAESVIGIGMEITFADKAVTMGTGNWYACCGIVQSQPPSRSVVGRIYVRPKEGGCSETDPTSHNSLQNAMLIKVEKVDGSDSALTVASFAQESGDWTRGNLKGTVGSLLSSYITGDVQKNERNFKAQNIPELDFNFIFDKPVRASEWMLEHGLQGKTPSSVELLVDTVSMGTYDVTPTSTGEDSAFEVVSIRVPPHLQLFGTKHTVRIVRSTSNDTVTVSRIWPSFHTSTVPWCLAMRVNGASNLLAYNSSYWTTDDQLNDEGNLKTPAFGSTPFRAIRVEFCQGEACNTRDIIDSDVSLQAWFQRAEAVIPTLDMKSIMPLGNNVQPYCNRAGRNLQFTTTARTRIGVIMSNKDGDCMSPDSMIGVGLDFSAWAGHTQRRISAGNWVGCCASKQDYPVPTHAAIANIYVNPQDGNCYDFSTGRAIRRLKLKIAAIGTRRGPQGIPGKPGADGKDGATGPAGPAGPIGPSGPPGPQGTPGSPGSTGPMGPLGPAGPTGAVGPMGPQGTPGEKGDQGPKGDVGVPGPKGDKGDPGPTGGKGDKGDPGPVGPSGPLGPLGNPGAPGESGLGGPTGVTGATGVQGPEGAAGPRGPKGQQGDPGQDGATGPIGPSGDSKIGPQGPVGPMGPQGLLGPAGPQGAPGPLGPQGVKGEVGKVGVKGEKGNEGPTGPSGNNRSESPKTSAADVEHPAVAKSIEEPAAANPVLQDLAKNGKLVPAVSA